jgi:hypothetical protein
MRHILHWFFNTFGKQIWEGYWEISFMKLVACFEIVRLIDHNVEYITVLYKDKLLYHNIKHFNPIP